MTIASTKMRRIFSGIQPTGVPHLGNYLGAIRNWVKLQHDSNNENIYCIVDQHSCTTHITPTEMRDNIFNMAASLIACGIDPNKSLIFQQSRVRFYNLYLLWSCFYTV